MDLKGPWGFVAGALSGAAATVVLAVVAVLVLPIDLSLGGRPDVEVAVEKLPGKASEQPIDPASCPTLTAELPPWAFDDDAKQHALQLPTPSPELDRRIEFWRAIWGEHPTHVYVFADKRRPSLIHSVVDCNDLFHPGADPGAAEDRCDRRLVVEKRKIVKRLSRERKRPSVELRRALDNERALLKDVHKNVFVMEGKSDELQAAVDRAAPHLDALEKIFATVGVPPALTRLSFVESLFQPGVESHAGAVGAFQFVEATGREWLMIDGDVDERLDPERAGWASASYLKGLHARFKEWPLALTAYNTGPTRMQRLVKRHRTRDIGDLADRRTERAFGFDGQNYYAQLFAVVRITEGVEPLEVSVRRHTVTMPAPLAIDVVARCTNTTAAAIAKLNPALRAAVARGERPIPKGYRLSLPPEAKAVSVEERKQVTAEQPS